MSRAVIRRSCSVGVVTAVMVLLAGCSGSGGGGSDEGAADVVVEESKGPAMSTAELARVALEDGGVEGHKVSKPSAGALVAQKDVETGEAECEAVAYALAGTVVGKPSAIVQRQTVGEPRSVKGSDADGPDAKEALSAAMELTTVMVTLAAYEGEGAQAAMDSLSTAADACGKGFALTVGGTGQQVTKVVKTTAPQGADQAIGLNVTSKQDGAKVPMKVIVIRKGGNVGYFTALNLASAGTGKDFAFPTEVVDAQLVKLA